MSAALRPASPAPEFAATDALQRAIARHTTVVFASSFGAEDMVVLDLIARARLPIRTFTLDTGRLPQETHDLIERARARYGLAIDVWVPDAQELGRFVGEHGPNAFYASRELRAECCRIRKTTPLARALAGAGAWVTGLRREQGVTRATVEVDEHDPLHGIAKVNPLALWTHAEVWEYLREHQVPWSALHERGYPSIGCAPCTRAVLPGDDPRSGRWWWENAEARECGLHRRPATARAVIPVEAVA